MLPARRAVSSVAAIATALALGTAVLTIAVAALTPAAAQSTSTAPASSSTTAPARAASPAADEPSVVKKMLDRRATDEQAARDTDDERDDVRRRDRAQRRAVADEVSRCESRQNVLRMYDPRARHIPRTAGDCATQAR